VHEASSLITKFRQLVYDVVEARREDPEHPALRRLGAATAVGLDPTEPRRALKLLEESERRQGGHRAMQFLGDAARQDLLELLAVAEDWGRSPVVEAPADPDLSLAEPREIPPPQASPWPRPEPPPPPLSLRDRLSRRARAWTRQALDRAGMYGLIR
jgi:hypothetical protein